MKTAVYSDAEYNILNLSLSERFDESYDYLYSLICEDEGIYDTPAEIIENLFHCDRFIPFPPIIIDFIVKLYHMEFENGNYCAFDELGTLYYNGERGFEQNYQKAMQYYQLAADKGCNSAQENLGCCYYYGRGIDKRDYEKAYHYFSISAFAGNVASLYRIGDMYRSGFYVNQDSEEAYRIYVNCYNMLNEDNEWYAAGPVYLRLGDSQYFGMGTHPDYEKALESYRRAEKYLFEMVKNGNSRYESSLDAAIIMQKTVKAELLKESKRFR